MEEKNKENIIDISISKEMETSFIDYAMSVIVSRAIPDARDGLKPVHRRILFAMNGLEMVHNKPFKKSARVVGEVIAKYHPHGDAAAYESMVRMAQHFSMRYPLIEGQGNFGSIDGDSAAAMRYTEARLEKISNLLLDDINKNTVDFQDNYDGSEREPIVLPSKIPNLLLNGSTGIAVGMATSIPPHNLNELINGTIALAKNPNIDILELLDYIPAPDFPTAGIIVNSNEIRQAYHTGRGRVIVRSKVKQEFDEKNSKGKLIISEIPYMVNKSALIIKIAELVKTKQIDSISDIRDESNREGIRVVITLKKGFLPEVELNKLFKMTQLQSNFPINLLALVKGKPETLNLKDALISFLEHQYDVLVRKTNFLLEKAEARKHILEGLSIALENIDAVIETIKKSSDNKTATENLMKNFKLSELQAKAVLDMKLQRLTGLERKTLEDEINKLDEEIKDHNLVLGSKDVQTTRIIQTLEETKQAFGDDRRSEISEDNFSNIEDEDLIPREDVVITVSKNGYVKRLAVEEYRTQGRGGMGARGASINDDDYISQILISNTHTDLLFFTTTGRVFKIRALTIPKLGKQAKGLPLVNLIDIDKGEQIKALLPVEDYKDKDFVFFTKNGLIKRTPSSEYQRVNKNGKLAILLREGDEILGVSLIDTTNENNKVMIGNSNGKTINFDIADVRKSGRKSSGVAGIKLDGGKAVDFGLSHFGDKVLVVSEKGFGKITPSSEYRLTKRGGKGVATLNVKKAGNLVAMKTVSGDEDLMIVTDKGTVIRLSLEDVSQTSRNTKGVKVINIKDGETITSIAIIQNETLPSNEPEELNNDKLILEEN